MQSLFTPGFKQQTEKAAKAGREEEEGTEIKKPAAGFIRDFSEGRFYQLLVIIESTKAKMKSSTVIAFSIVVVLTFLGVSEGRSVRSLGVEPHCRCIETESRRIGRHIKTIELIFPNSHCERTEIIATLKTSGKEVCLNPEAPWVIKVITNRTSSNPK